MQEALEILAQNADYNDNEGRSVAFRRAASVLKALPRRVRSMQDLRWLPCLGDHSQRVIKVIIKLPYLLKDPYYLDASANKAISPF